MSTFRSALILSSIAVLAPARAFAVTFPADEVYAPLRCHSAVMTDGFQDATGFFGARDVVGTVPAPAGLRASDDSYLYLRMRLDQDAAPGGVLAASSWGMAFDLDGDRRTYELLVLVSNVGGTTGTVSVFTNHTTTTPDDRADPADLPAAASYAFADNARTIATTSTNGGDPDFFLDVAIPWSALVPLGLDHDTRTYVWVASSDMADRLDGDFACFDERGGTPTLSGTASDSTTGDPASDDGGPGGVRLEGGGGCSAGGDAGASLTLGIVLVCVTSRRRRVRRT